MPILNVKAILLKHTTEAFTTGQRELSSTLNKHPKTSKHYRLESQRLHKCFSEHKNDSLRAAVSGSRRDTRSTFGDQVRPEWSVCIVLGLHSTGGAMCFLIYFVVRGQIYLDSLTDQNRRGWCLQSTCQD